MTMMVVGMGMGMKNDNDDGQDDVNTDGKGDQSYGYEVEGGRRRSRFPCPACQTMCSSWHRKIFVLDII